MQPIYILQPVSNAAASAAEIEVPVTGRIQIGRESNNDISLPHDKRMSSVHFELTAEPGGCRARDLGSSNGTFLNSRRIVNALLVEGDELQAGESRWRVAVRPPPGGAYPSSPAPALAASGWQVSSSDSGTARPVSAPPAPAPPSAAAPSSASPSLDLLLSAPSGDSRRLRPGQSLTVGRRSLAEWVFGEDQQMSSLHVELFEDAGAWHFNDLESSNGTYLNETRLSEGRLNHGDELRCGQTRFLISLVPHASQPPTSQPPPSRRSSSGRAEAAGHPTPTGQPQAARLRTPPLSERLPPRATTPATTLPASLRRVSDGHQFALPPGKLLQLGRGPALDISLPDDWEVSTNHATLQFDGERVVLHDVGSFNGTFVDGQRTTHCRLADGHRFRVGQTEFEVCLPQAALSGDSGDTAHEPPAGDWQPPTPYPQELPTPHPITPKPITPVRATPEPLSSEPIAPEPKTSEAITAERLTPESISPEPITTERPTTESITPERPTAEPASYAATAGERQAAAQPIAPQPIDWEDPSGYAEQAEQLQPLACRSELILFRGRTSGLDPVDVALRFLQSTNGWVLNGGNIENWMEAARQGLQGLPQEWLSPARADDASWMVPFLNNWGSGQAWLVFSSVTLEDALQKLLSLRPIAEDAAPLMPALTPRALANFLADTDPAAIRRFFEPLDGVLVEIHPGDSWALFIRPDLAKVWPH